MIVDIYIGNFKLDTFKDESVELNNSIANVNDITKNTTDYTKSFTVPASHVNNKVFKHYYNANIDNSFDARTKVDGRIDLKGIPFKYGKWRLAKVIVKQGKPSSYTINFWGNLVSLKTKFKDDLLSDLDLSAYNHAYNSNNVKAGLTGSLFSGNIFYNLFSKKQLYYKGVNTDNVNTAKLANIAWAGGSNTGVIWRDLKPSIRITPVINAIATKYGLTFSNDFFGRSEFMDLNMWLNNGDGIKGGTERVNFTSGNTSYVNLTTDIVSLDPIFLAGNTVRFTTRLQMTPDAGYETIPYTIITYLDGQVYSSAEFTGVGVVTHTSNNMNRLNQDYQIYYEIKTDEIFAYTTKIDVIRTAVLGGSSSTLTFTTIGFDTVAFDFNIAQNIPKIKVIDFMAGLFKMFKLVVIADRYDNVYINTLNDYYAQGKLYDLTRHIDFSSNEVERGNLLNQINFNFEEPTTLLNTQFKANNNIAYGDEDLTINDANGELLDGETLDVKLPFEQVIYERLTDLQDNVQTNIMYGGIFDEQIEGVNPAPHLFYNINQNITLKPIAFIDDTNARTRINSLNVPLHTQGIINPQYSTVFGKERNEWDGVVISNTLYSNYYKNYVEAIFNIKRRNFSFTAKDVPLRIMTKLQLNDVIKVKSDYFRMDNYNFNLLSGDVQLKLINSFDNILNPFNADRRLIFVDYTAQTQTVYVTNLNNFDYNSTELWVSATALGNVVTFNIDENTTGLDRYAVVTIINSETFQEIDVEIFQTPNTVSFDSDTITFDSNLITFDNG